MGKSTSGTTTDRKRRIHLQPMEVIHEPIKMAPAVGLYVLAHGSTVRLRNRGLPLIAAWSSNRGSHPTEDTKIRCNGWLQR